MPLPSENNSNIQFVDAPKFRASAVCHRISEFFTLPETKKNAPENRRLEDFRLSFFEAGNA